MPRQVLKIDQFHGGVNNNSDPRDLLDNEFCALHNFVVSDVGKVRPLGGGATHDIDAQANQINPGYGLFQFSHDRIAGVVGNLEHLNNTGDFSSNWDGGNGWTLDSTDATYANHASPADLIQTAANRAVRGIANTKYAFTYTISGFSETITLFEILGTGSQFAAATTALEQSNGTHTTTFTSHATNPNHPFTINVTSSTSGAFNIDNVSLKIYDVAETGDDYIAFSEPDTGGTVDIYSKNNDVTGAVVWNSPITGMSSVVAGNRKDTFYYANGALRISDSNFGNANEPVWYGYVHRYFFGDGTSGYDGDSYDEGKLISTWFKDEAAPKALPIKSFMGAIAGSTPDISSPISIDLDPTGDYQNVSSSGTIQDDTNVIQVVVAFSATSPNVTALTNTTPGFSRFCSIGDKINITDSLGSGENDQIFTVSDVPEYGTDPDPNTMDFEETVDARTPDTVYMTNLSKSAWFDPVNTGWQVAVSTLYDDNKQESALDISSTTLQPNDTGSNNEIIATSTGYKKIRIDAHVFAGDGITTGLAVIHPRVSGFKIYMRRENTATWFLQAEIDMTKGNRWFGRGDWEMWEDGVELTACAHADGEYLDAPREVETYESETGYDSSITAVGFDGTSAGFKTAVVANNIAYAGNVRIGDWKGNVKTYGDAILKSVVGKYDSFVLERRIETSNQDGDSIIKLEEYADRLLEFKKNKMSLINISQELEFLEDTFLHKGVTHPSAVCRTDYGVAWVNTLGCYLYDGQRVSNLLEKKGRQMIKVDGTATAEAPSWSDFTQYGPSMIGYLPKKRQLIVVDRNDGSGGGGGKIYLYDMVTQSWVNSGNGTLTDAALTNLVIDWNNDLTWIHTSDTGTAMKWDDTADAHTNADVKTKDFDFGHPGLKKNVYKVLVSYKGDADAILCKYSVDGDTDTLYNFNDDNTPLADQTDLTKWHIAELVPTTASVAKNIYSFRFHMEGAIPDADVEFNDISIIYRVKGVR